MKTAKPWSISGDANTRYIRRLAYAASTPERQARHLARCAAAEARHARAGLTGNAPTSPGTYEDTTHVLSALDAAVAALTGGAA